MALNDVTFIEGQGGLGRPLPGGDFISALLCYAATLPSGFTTSNRIKQIFSPSDAIALGIKNDYSDATAATVTYLITTKGNTGDKIKAVYTGILGAIFDTGFYTVLSTHTTIALQGAAWAAAINATTYLHGCTASFTTATLTITLPKSQGIFPNSGTPVAIVTTGAWAGTLTQAVVAGVASAQAVWYYHISEFFRMQPKGQLFVGMFAVPGGSYDFTEITTMQNFADGKIRQMGVYVQKAYASGDLQLISDEITTNDDANHKPLSALLGADISVVTDLSTLADLNTLTANKASIVIGQDGAAQGAFLYAHTGKSITCLGAVLGAESAGLVSDSIAHKGKFNFSNGVELDTPAFANGALVKNTSVNLVTAIDASRYIFLIKNVGLAGTFVNNDHTAIISSSDYAQIRDNRTIDKAERGVYASLLPDVSAPLVLNADGTLTDDTIEYFRSKAGSPLAQMVRDGELSDYKVEISSTQNVLSTRKLQITIKLLPIGAADFIEVTIGYTTSIS